MFQRKLSGAVLSIVLAFVGCNSTTGDLRNVQTITPKGVAEVVHQNSGSVVLVNVWATWCMPCMQELPDLLKLQKSYADRDFKLILLSADDMEFLSGKVRPTLKKLGVNFPTYIRAEGDDESFLTGMHPDWSGALPTSFLYNKKGELVEMMVGKRSFEQFEERIQSLLAE